MPIVFLSSVVVLAACAAFVWWLERSHRKAQVAELENSNRTLIDQWIEARDRLDEAKEQLGARDQQIARLEERTAAEQKAFEQMRSSLPDTFKALASEVLDEKSKAFAQQNQVSLEHLLSPLKNRLEDFQRKVETAHTDQVKDSATLREQLKSMVESASEVADQANRLALALKGSSKMQGIWGELVLERILESAGLEKGREFDTQESYAAENGRRSQPDVVVHLPGNKHLIIDSKVSLVDYETYCNSQSDDLRADALARHANSVRTHIRGLAEKNYQSLYGLTSLDFVIMFLPVEPAFMLALSRDSKLLEQAWQRDVLLVSPSTLVFVLRTVAALWGQERQQRNVEEIVKRGADLYNKLAGFAADLEEIGDRLEQAHRSYDAALNKLSAGRGSVIRQAEILKSLGVRPSKQIPQGILDLAEQETSELENGAGLE